MANRPCGDCGLCCKVMAIKELRKPAGKWCRYWKNGIGCRIHSTETYPKECREFECMYIATEKEIPEIFPKKIKAVIAKCNVVPDQGGLGLYVDKEFKHVPFLNETITKHNKPIWGIEWWKKEGIALNIKASNLKTYFTIEDDFDE